MRRGRLVWVETEEEVGIRRGPDVARCGPFQASLDENLDSFKLLSILMTL